MTTLRVVRRTGEKHETCSHEEGALWAQNFFRDSGLLGRNVDLIETVFSLFFPGHPLAMFRWNKARLLRVERAVAACYDLWSKAEDEAIQETIKNLLAKDSCPEVCRFGRTPSLRTSLGHLEHVLRRRVEDGHPSINRSHHAYIQLVLLTILTTK